LLGGGPRAFQKYEAGTQAVSSPMSHLLTLLANDPKRLDELRGLRSTARQRAPRQKVRTATNGIRRQRSSA
jgi:HTH-type transcriptional regulator/antitoxin MqsA